MSEGKLEVLLVSAKGLDNSDFLRKLLIRDLGLCSFFCGFLESDDLDFFPPLIYLILWYKSAPACLCDGCADCLNVFLTFFYLFADNIDPYVLLTCRTQEQKSSVASGTIAKLFGRMLSVCIVFGLIWS